MARGKGRFLIACVLLSAVIPLEAETFRFQAQRMSGSRASGKDRTILEGEAQVLSDSLTLKADRIELSGDENRFVECSGAVTGFDEKKGVFFRTIRLRYDRKSKIARLEGDSAMEDKKNSVVAKARFIEYNDKTGTTVLQIGVRLFKDELVCRSEWALYRREEKKLDLAGAPVVFKKGDEFRANRMRVDLDTDDIFMEGSVSGSIKEKKQDSADGKPEESKPADGKVEEKTGTTDGGQPVERGGGKTSDAEGKNDA